MFVHKTKSLYFWVIQIPEKKKKLNYNLSIKIIKKKKKNRFVFILQFKNYENDTNKQLNKLNKR